MMAAMILTLAIIMVAGFNVRFEDKYTIKPMVYPATQDISKVAGQNPKDRICTPKSDKKNIAAVINTRDKNMKPINTNKKQVDTIGSTTNLKPIVPNKQQDDTIGDGSNTNMNPVVPNKKQVDTIDDGINTNLNTVDTDMKPCDVIVERSSSSSSISHTTGEEWLSPKNINEDDDLNKDSTTENTKSRFGNIWKKKVKKEKISNSNEDDSNTEKTKKKGYFNIFKSKESK